MIDRVYFSAAGWRRMFSTAAIGAVVALASGAQAAPMGLANRADVSSQLAQPHVLQVRDGCGRGMRYSERRDACVEDFDGGPRGYDDRGPPPPPPMYDRRPPPPPDYDRGGPGYREQRVIETPDCGRGLRYSNRLQGCVRIEGAVEDRRGDNDVATGALVGGAVGAIIGSAIRENAGRR